MPTVHTSEQFARLIEPGLTSVMEGHYGSLPNMRQILYRMEKTNKTWESYFSVGDVPDVPEFTGTIDYLAISPGYYTKIEPKEYAGGLQFQRKFIDDLQYPVMRNHSKKLMESMNRVQEKAGADTLGEAFSTSFAYQTSEEGVSLCSSSHKTKSGVSTSSGFDNAGTTALSKTEVAATAILMKQFRSDIGERMPMNPNTLIVTENDEDTAREIIESRLDPDTANNAINPQYGKWKLIVYPLLSDYDTNNWFMTDFRLQKEYLIWLDRIKPETKVTVDFNTYITQVAVYGRFGCGFIDWRWIYGHEVS